MHDNERYTTGGMRPRMREEAEVTARAVDTFINTLAGVKDRGLWRSNSIIITFGGQTTSLNAVASSKTTILPDLSE